MNSTHRRHVPQAGFSSGIYTSLPAVNDRKLEQLSSIATAWYTYQAVAMDKSRQTHLLQRVAKQLSASAQHVFSASDLIEFLDDLRADGVLPKSPSSHKLHQLIVDSGIVQEIKITATYPFESKRYHRGPFSPYELALSLKPDSYLSHGTAVYLHKLSAHEPNMIYVNKEQSPKDSSGDLTQAGIDRAFSTKQRTSGFQLHHGRTTITLLNGKHSGRLGVVTMQGPNGEPLEVTDLERTLIDIVVRPNRSLQITARSSLVRQWMTGLIRQA
jgi:hypothetical protein